MALAHVKGLTNNRVRNHWADASCCTTLGKPVLFYGPRCEGPGNFLRAAGSSAEPDRISTRLAIPQARLTRNQTTSLPFGLHTGLLSTRLAYYLPHPFLHTLKLSRSSGEQSMASAEVWSIAPVRIDKCTSSSHMFVQMRMGHARRRP